MYLQQPKLLLYIYWSDIPHPLLTLQNYPPLLQYVHCHLLYSHSLQLTFSPTLKHSVHSPPSLYNHSLFLFHLCLQGIHTQSLISLCPLSFTLIYPPHDTYPSLPFVLEPHFPFIFITCSAKTRNLYSCIIFQSLSFIILLHQYTSIKPVLRIKDILEVDWAGSALAP